MIGGNLHSQSKGQYAGITGLQVSVVDNNGVYVARNLNVTTRYNENNNIVLTRSSQYGVNTSTLVSPKLVSNGILSKVDGGYKGLKNWKFNDSDTPQLLSVLIHQQILAFYSKPNNVLTGELVTDDPTFDALYKWGGKDHLLMSGTLNILTGRMENAVLREFMRYDHMWETWVEREYYNLSKDANDVTTYIHSNKEITNESIKGLPSWITAGLFETVGGYYGITLHVASNSFEKRSATIYIDTAFIRVDQAGATDVVDADFNEDFNEDFN